MGWRQEPCICGKHYKNVHPVWYGWKVNWEQIKNKLSPESRKLLKQEFICNFCRDSIKAEISNII